MSNTSLSTEPVTFSGSEATRTSAMEFRRDYAHAMRGQFVGPMPTRDFLDDFRPAGISDMPKFDNTFFKDLKGIQREADLCRKFAGTVNSDLIPEFELVDLSGTLDTESPVKLRPDVVMYPQGHGTQSKIQFDKMELQFEFKLKPADPFCDPSMHHEFESDTKDGISARGHLIGRATEWFRRQHRCFAFTLWMGGSFARFIRWDRAGAVVSKNFNYIEDSTYLLEFLWRFTHLDAADRGWDPTVRVATEQQKELAKEHLGEHYDENQDVLVFDVTSPDGGVRSFIGSKSMAYPHLPTGRGTRAYPVYDEQEKRLCFLKDTWRAESIESEAAIIELLNSKKVEYVPRFICGGDIFGQTTLTDEYINKQSGDLTSEGEGTSWRCGTAWPRITRRCHHRMITDTIGRQLNTFTSSKEMMQVISDAYTAHQKAYEKCCVIHRDISANNILITQDGSGMLNDWDLARRVTEMPLGPRDQRTGTWQFMSYGLLGDVTKLHTIQDDIESFFYVVLYHSIRYLNHNRIMSVEEILRQIFDYQIIRRDGTRLGGDMKSLLITSQGGEPSTFEGFELKNTILNNWIFNTLGALAQWKANIRNPKLPLADHLKLRDHDYLANQFKSYLAEPEWPVHERIQDWISQKPNTSAAAIPSVTEAADLGSTRSRKRATADFEGSKSSKKAKRSLPEHGA